MLVLRPSILLTKTIAFLVSAVSDQTITERKDCRESKVCSSFNMKEEQTKQRKQSTTATKKEKKSPKPKLTKEQRREKYTQIARERSVRQRARTATAKLICYQCRQRGHSIAQCPANAGDSNDATKKKKDQTKQRQSTSSPEEEDNKSRLSTGNKSICFQCGSTEHSLASCPQPPTENGQLPFATCFICHEKGHLARQCPQNEKGIYIKGGSCKVCGSKQHRASACPEQKKMRANDETEKEEADNVDDLLSDQEDNHQPQRDAESVQRPSVGSSSSTTPLHKKRRVVNF